MLDALYDKNRAEQINRGESVPNERKKKMDDNNKTNRMNNKVKRQRKKEKFQTPTKHRKDVNTVG